MLPRKLALTSAAALLVAACSSTGTATAPASAAPPAASASAAAAETRIDVSLSDQLRIEPASMTVKAGVPVTFVVTNNGAIDHEFVVGDEAAQAEHEQAMMAGGMQHDEPGAIFVKPGETKELTYTFAQPGNMLAGCHEAGHYGGGMKASIIVTD